MLKIQEKDKTRVNVFLDEEFAFAITLNAAMNLRKGQQLSEAEIEQLKAADERQRAYTKALYFLGFRSRSQAEIEQYLREKEYTAPVIQEVVQRLLAEKYLDDEAFARSWVDSREQLRPRSSRALRYELRQKGVDATVIDELVETVDDEAAAWAAVESKLARWQTLEQQEFFKKLSGFLGRRGFTYEVTRRVYKRAWAELGEAKNTEAENTEAENKELDEVD
ncbi:MAG: RecX family transcriptional regulator [Chloroflexi bacterium]|nr:RecX family transcriptional regulator [Chloroflexota bacterium]